MKVSTPLLLLVLLVAVALTTPLAHGDDCKREQRDLDECSVREASATELYNAMDRKANATEEASNKRRDKFFACQEKVDKDNGDWQTEKAELVARVATLDKKVNDLEQQLAAQDREL